MVEETIKTYIPQVYNELSYKWEDVTTKSGNALHKSYRQAYNKVKNKHIRGRVITYVLVQEDVVYSEKEDSYE